MGEAMGLGLAVSILGDCGMSVDLRLRRERPDRLGWRCPWWVAVPGRAICTPEYREEHDGMVA